MSIAKTCLRLSGLFEAELLVELMLRYWKHPLADNRDFRNNLLERAAEALREAVRGIQLIEGVPARDLNLVAAVWYGEWNALSSGEEDPSGRRQAWLKAVRRAVPSCFCDPDRLS